MPGKLGKKSPRARLACGAGDACLGGFRGKATRNAHARTRARLARGARGAPAGRGAARRACRMAIAGWAIRASALQCPMAVPAVAPHFAGRGVPCPASRRPAGFALGRRVPNQTSQTAAPPRRPRTAASHGQGTGVAGVAAPCCSSSESGPRTGRRGWQARKARNKAAARGASRAAPAAPQRPERRPRSPITVLTFHKAERLPR